LMARRWRDRCLGIASCGLAGRFRAVQTRLQRLFNDDDHAAYKRGPPWSALDSGRFRRRAWSSWWSRWKQH